MKFSINSYCAEKSILSKCRDALTGRIQTVQLDNYHFFSRYAMHMRRYIMHKSILETERLYLAHQSSEPQEVSLKQLTISQYGKRKLKQPSEKIWMTGLFQAKVIILMQNHKAKPSTGFESLNYSQPTAPFQSWVPCSAFHCLIALKRCFP